jgi:hypothetical protein
LAVVLAALPITYIASHVIAASRNIIFWDEFDAALDLILKIDSGIGWREILHRFFAVSNEHRMVTSRVLFAVSYWTTGSVNFHAITAIGNSFIVVACLLLVWAQRTFSGRIRLGLILALLVFQLEHFENFLWSGASIDHFQVVMFAVGAGVALARPSRAGLAVGALCSVLATFTLAHGLVLWPLGALALWHQRRWRALGPWLAVSVLAVAAFFQGFELNPGHRINAIDLSVINRLGHFWLSLLGAPCTFGDTTLAALPGVLLLGGFAGLALRGIRRGELTAWFVAGFGIGSLALVAIGRTELAGTQVNSRYMILAALPWAMLIHLFLGRVSNPRRPLAWLLPVLPVLVAFNLAANIRFAPSVDAFLEVRERAASRFKQYGEDGRGIVSLHPQKGHADKLLKQASERGIYRLPRMSEVIEIPKATVSQRIIAHVDETIVNDRAITIGGWGMIPAIESKRGQVFLVLKSETQTLFFSTITLQRPDVAKAYNEPLWKMSGFRAVFRRTRIPADTYQIGVLIRLGRNAEYVMTKSQLVLGPEGATPLASVE